MDEKQIEILPELRDYIGALADDELVGLEERLKTEGCPDPLVVWEHDSKRILIDGHHRYAICQRHHIPFETRAVPLDTLDDVKIWMIKTQFGRRNLAPYRRAELAIELEPMLAKQAKEKQRQGGLEKVPQTSSEAMETRDLVSKMAKVSHDTLRKAKVIKKRANPQTVAALRKEETTINKVFNEVKDQPKPLERIHIPDSPARPSGLKKKKLSPAQTYPHFVNHVNAAIEMIPKIPGREKQALDLARHLVRELEKAQAKLSKSKTVPAGVSV